MTLNVTANIFDVRVDNAGSAAFSGCIDYIAVEEGVYDEPGFKLEAVKHSEAQTSGKSGGWDMRRWLMSYRCTTLRSCPQFRLPN